MRKRYKFYYKNYTLKINKTFVRRSVLRFIRGYTDRRLLYLRQFTIMLLSKSSNCSYSFIHLFCLHTGRTRFVLPMFKLSRIAFRENLSEGFGSGVYRYS